MVKVSIITTVNHNVGDDFVREGIIHLLRKAWGPLNAQFIHKHLPFTARPELSWVHSSRLDHKIFGNDLRVVEKLGRWTDRLLPVFPWSDTIRNCDALVQSGAPIYWLNSDGDCAHNEWWEPLIERRWKSISKGRPFLNLAGGTCQPWQSDGSEFVDRKDVLEYIRNFFDLTRLTTLRDELSLKVLGLAGRKAEVLPCTSIFAVDNLGISFSPGEYVVLNYMPAGGHFRFGQPIDAQLWERRFAEFVSALSKRERCVMACHDEKELKAAARLFPKLEIFHSHNHKDFLQFYAKAKWGVMNRVHGGFALASLGKPAAIIGSDTRAQMASMIGLPSVFVNDATPEWLATQADLMEEKQNSFPKFMRALKDDSEARYIQLLSAALN